MNRHQDDDVDRTLDYPRHYHNHDGNDLIGNRIIWGWAAGTTLILAGLGGVAIGKLVDVSDRLARVETLVQVIAQKEGIR